MLRELLYSWVLARWRPASCARYSAHRQSKGQAALAQTAVAAEMAFLSLRGKQGAENHRKHTIFLKAIGLMGFYGYQVDGIWTVICFPGRQQKMKIFFKKANVKGRTTTWNLIVPEIYLAWRFPFGCFRTMPSLKWRAYWKGPQQWNEESLPSLTSFFGVSPLLGSVTWRVTWFSEVIVWMKFVGEIWSFTQI